MRSLILLLLVLAGLPCPGRAVQAVPISHTVEAIVERIAGVNELMDHAVGYSGRRPPQWDNFIELRNTASTGELLSLARHSNGVVRCYAFWALSGRDQVDLFSLVLGHIDDDEEVKYLFGDQGGTLRVGDFFIDQVQSSLTEDQKEELGRILLVTDNELSATAKVLRAIQPEERWYPRIRALARQGNPDALVVLSQYRKEQDIEVILAQYKKAIENDGSLFDIYRAARHYPHPALFPVLEQRFDLALAEDYPSNATRELYLAVASYQDEAAMHLLNRTFTEANSLGSREGHLLALYTAAETYRNPLYDELLWKLWVEHYYVTRDAVQYLYPKDQARALRAIKTSLTEPYRLYFGALDATIPHMLRLLLAADHQAAIEIMRDNLLTAHVHIFRPFARVAAEIRDDALIEPLFSRLESDSNIHIYVAAGLVLLLYEDEEIDQRLGQVDKLGPEFVADWRDAGSERIRSYLNAQ